MVKLIRLASNNDGLFKSAFGSSIDIKPNGKIALLNLTFRTDFNVLNIDDSNNEITFWSDYPAVEPNTINLPYIDTLHLSIHLMTKPTKNPTLLYY